MTHTSSAWIVIILWTQFGPRSKFGIEKPLSTLQLTATTLGVIPNQSRHKLGLGHPALPLQKNPLHFFSLLASFTTHHPTLEQDA